jgi:hypothetical protein
MKSTYIIRFVVVLAVVFATPLLFSNIATAQGNQTNVDLVKVDSPGSPPTFGDKVGTVKVIDKPKGGDILKLKVRNLNPNATIRVFITSSEGSDDTPAVFLGDFKTNPQGKGVFIVKVEVFDAFVIVEDTPIQSEDLVHIRLYLDEGTGDFGGDHLASTESEIN